MAYSQTAMPETDATSLEALLVQIALGNRAAFAALYRGTASRLFGICLRVLSQRSEAEDALQDVYTAVWRKAAQFDPAKASATAWLAMIARNKSIDRLRAMPSQQGRASFELADEVEDPTASPAHAVQTAADRAQMEQCLQRLEPKRRSLIRAAFFDGLTYEELAASIEAPLGSIKSWIRRGLLQLRECLDP
jgi:RNA polymerase sigma-70 factor, ECF subfamily